MSWQTTLHLLVVIMTHNDNHSTWGAADGINELPCPNNLTKYLCLRSHGMDEEKQTINEKLQCLGPYLQLVVKPLTALQNLH